MVDKIEKLLEMQYTFWLLVIGVALMGAGVYFFLDLVNMEATGEVIQMKKVLRMLYQAGGKYAVLALFELAGVVCLIAGISQLRNRKG